MTRRPLVPDRWAWAAAIICDDLEFAYAGVDRPSHRDRRFKEKDSYLSWHLTASGRYMDKHCEEAAKYYMESDADDDWRECCEEGIAKEHCCAKPSVYDEYRADVKKLFEDEDARQRWAFDRVDPPWEWDQIRQECTEIYFVYWLLKEHPVIAIRGDDNEWFDIDDVVGYCPGCQRPVLSEDVTPAPGDDSQRVLHCHPCGYDEHLLDTPDDPPFDWPPGAPLPRHPDGSVAPPPPEDFEEYMNAARDRRRRLCEDATDRDRAGGAVPEGQP